MSQRILHKNRMNAPPENTSTPAVNNTSTPMKNNAKANNASNNAPNNAPKNASNNAPKNATNNAKTNNASNNAKTNNAKTNNVKTNASAPSEETEAVQTQLQQNTNSLQQAIDGGDCKVIQEEVKKVVKSGNSVMSMINAGKAKEEDFSDTKSRIQTAITNIKAKCPPTQAGGKRKTRKQKRKARKSRRRM